LGGLKSSIGDILTLGEGKLADLVKDKIKEQAKDAVKNYIHQKLVGHPPEVFITESNGGNCRVRMVAIWDMAADTYEILVFGDCNCTPQPTGTVQGPIRLRTFLIRITGNVTVSPESTKTVPLLNVGYPKIEIKANCDCDKQKTKTTTQPTGPGTTPQPGQPEGPGGTTPQPPVDVTEICKRKPPCKECMPIYDLIVAGCKRIAEIDAEQRDLAGQYAGAKSRGAEDEAKQLAEQSRKLGVERQAIEGALKDLAEQLKECEKPPCGPKKAAPPPKGGGIPVPPPGTTTPPKAAPPPEKKPAGGVGGGSEGGVSFPTPGGDQPLAGGYTVGDGGGLVNQPGVSDSSKALYQYLGKDACEYAAWLHQRAQVERDGVKGISDSAVKAQWQKQADDLDASARQWEARGKYYDPEACNPPTAMIPGGKPAGPPQPPVKVTTNFAATTLPGTTPQFGSGWLVTSGPSWVYNPPPVFGTNKPDVSAFGAELSGPIVKDKLWFYGSYGKQDIRLSNTITKSSGNAIQDFVGGAGLFVTNPEFVQQYVLVTNQFGPEFGRNAAPAVNVLTNSFGPSWSDSILASRSFGSSTARGNTTRFGPSLGFAYSPQWGGFLTGRGTTILRGGYRMLYDPPFYNIYLNIPTSSPSVFLQTPTSPYPSSPPGFNAVSSWSFGFERELTKNSAFEVRYAGNRAYDLSQSVGGFTPAIDPSAVLHTSDAFGGLISGVGTNDILSIVNRSIARYPNPYSTGGSVGTGSLAQPSPLSFRIGGAEFTPGGFVDIENIFRSPTGGSINVVGGTGSGIGTFGGPNWVSPTPVPWLGFGPASGGTGTGITTPIFPTPATRGQMAIEIIRSKLGAGGPSWVSPTPAPWLGFGPTGGSTGTGITTPSFTTPFFQTPLLYPFVTNTLGFDTGLSIAATSTDPFGTSSPYLGFGSTSGSAGTGTGGIVPSIPGVTGIGVLNPLNYPNLVFGGSGSATLAELLKRLQDLLSALAFAAGGSASEAAEVLGPDDLVLRIDQQGRVILSRGPWELATLNTAPPFALESGTAAWMAAPLPSELPPQITYSLVANGNSAGEAFQLQVMDPSGQFKKVALPDGVALQPAAPPPQKPAKQTGNMLTQQITAYCLQFAKLPPAAGMLYKIADPATQLQYKPLRYVLEAARKLGAGGQLHPDSDLTKYVDAIRQYAVWTKQEGWDQQQFTEHWVERTRKSAQAMNIPWTQQMEDTLRAAAPGRWRDISQVLQEAESMMRSESSPAR
jgi:hypothetical protein